MKKSDIIKLVKETVAERRKRYGQHDYYGNNVGGRNSISGMPGVWEEGNNYSLSSDILNYADQYHMELVDTLKGVSTHPDKRTGGIYFKFPHASGPTNPALFGKETVDKIEKSKAAAKAAAQKTVDKWKDYIEDYEITDSKSGVYGNVWLWIMPSDLGNNYSSPKGGTQSSQFENKDKYLNENKMKKIKEATYAGKTAVDDMTKDPAYTALDGDAKMQLKKDLSQGGTATLEEDDESLLAEYMKERGDSNLMEHMDRHRKRTRLMEGAVKRLFIDFDLGKTNEEIIQDYATKGIQIPDSWISQMRKEWEGFEKMKLNLDIGEKEFKNAATQIVNNPEGSETGMEPPIESKQLASGLSN